MNHNDIRRTFLEFFKARDHKHVAASNVIVEGDPTLLFVNAGMNQFKDVLLGKEKRDYKRAITIQPCMRVGGKHNDLDEVGRNGRHLTWFEMLGNWSFGDYGKREAIQFAWDLVTQHFPLDINKVYATVYKDDDEAYGLWQEISTLPDERIVRLGDIEQGDEENFWSMGPIGPCGRCTELYYDQGEEKFGHDVVGGETDRFLEFWNVVFMEFDRQEDGKMVPLPALSVDTGMGMERITALLEGKDNIFETSLFRPIINYIAEQSGKPKEAEFLTAMQVLADHSRALTFTLNDGGTFDKQGRGYVLRRILRRAVLHGTKLGFSEPFIYKLVAEQVKNLPDYNINQDQQSKIAEQIKQEEERFFQTLDRGVQFFNEAATTGTITGEAAFKLHDTYGFPIDLTTIMAEEKGITIDMDGFDAALQNQKEQSRAAGKFKDEGGWTVLKDGFAQTLVTHDLTELETDVLKYRQVDGTTEVVLEQSPFYIESGGEVGDQGVLRHPERSEGSLSATDDQSERKILHCVQDDDLMVQNVYKTDRDIIHVIEQTNTIPERVKAIVNTDNRQQKAIHHTATHLLHAAVRHVLGENVTQAGSLVENNRLRFDIKFDRAMIPEERDAVENWVNNAILKADTVSHKPDLSMDQAKELGALAFFGDKYGDKVRVIDIPGVSVELCGGNHVKNTAEIGSFALLSDEALGSGVRRLTAVVGMPAVTIARQNRQQLQTLAQNLSVPANQLPDRIEKLQQELKEAKASYNKLLKSGNTGGQLTEETVELDGQSLILADASYLPLDSIAGQLDKLKAENPENAYVYVHIDDEEKGTLFISAGKDSGAHAGKLAKNLGTALGSGGGGKPDFARAGFKGKTFESVRKVIS